MDLPPVINAFLTYDERQAAATRLPGLRTVAPGLERAGLLEERPDPHSVSSFSAERLTPAVA